ncbi:hypothetical protein V6Z12_A01G104700 [Gossypium hirsutum]
MLFIKQKKTYNKASKCSKNQNYKILSLHLPNSAESPNISFPNALSSSTSFEPLSELRFQRSEQGFEATKRYGASWRW